MKLITQLIKKLDKIIELLTAEKEFRDKAEEDRLRTEREAMLREYAMRHNKKFPSPRAMSSNELQDRPIDGAMDCIPYNLSDTDKAILSMYYENTDNRTNR